MMAAIDRYFGFSGGETIGFVTLAAVLLWLASPHVADAQTLMAHVRTAIDCACPKL